jgi:anti-anti-sigma regulatory factor
MDGVLVNESGPPDGVVMTVHIRADASSETVDELRSVLVRAILRRRPARIVIDLDGPATVDSAIVGTLRAAYEAACDVHVPLVLHSGAPVRTHLLHEVGVPTCACAAAADPEILAA